MVRCIIVVREVGGLKPDYSLEFDLPEVPKPGAYISIYRGIPAGPYSEDLVVEKIWWDLNHPDCYLTDGSTAVGNAINIMVECTPAIGPTSNDRWRDMLTAHTARGVAVPVFEVERFGISRDELPPNRGESNAAAEQS